MKKLIIPSLFVLFAFAGCRKAGLSERETQDPAAVKPAAQTNISALMHSSGCTYSYGYWKTHGPGNCRKGNNPNTWPVDTLEIGGVKYGAADLCSIMHTSSKGDKRTALMHQLIAALLNVANGATSYDQAILDAAEAAIANNDMSNAVALAADLEFFNLGGEDNIYHCPDSNGVIIGEP